MIFFLSRKNQNHSEMEASVAKRLRLEPQNAEEIIQEQRSVIENLKAQNQQLEEQLKTSESRNQQLEEQLKFLESSAMETKIKNILVPELPNEIWLEIMSYLSTYDVLRNVAQVSKRFHKLSEDPHLIRKIEVEFDQSWPEDINEKYCDDFLGVLKRSQKLKSLSFGSTLDIKSDKSGQMFFQALPSMNHQFLQEFCLKADGDKEYHYRNVSIVLEDISHPLNQNILKYLGNCPDLKVLKLEFKDWFDEYPLFTYMEEGITSFKLKNLQEFHLKGFDIGNYFDDSDFQDVLEKIAENLPKLQRLHLGFKDVEKFLDLHNQAPTRFEICQEFASEKNIKIETYTILNQRGKCCCGNDLWFYFRPLK